MNPTLDLFRRTSQVFVRFPILWVPLLLADVLRAVLNTFVPQLVRGALLASAPKSALGGIAALPKPGTIAAISAGIGFAATAIGLLLYLYALGVIALALMDRTDHSSWKPKLNFDFPRGIWGAWLQACALAALFALFSATVISWIVRSGARGGSVQARVFAAVLPFLTLLIYPATVLLRRYVLKVQGEAANDAWPRLPYYLLLLASAIASNLAGTGIAFATRRTSAMPGIRQSFAFLLLQMLTSLAAAFPYAYAAVGLSLRPAAGAERRPETWASPHD